MQGNVGNVKLFDLLESDKFGEVLYDPACIKSLTYVTAQHGSEVISQEEAVDANEKFDPFADPAPQTVSKKRTLPSLSSGAAGASSAPDPVPPSGRGRGKAFKSRSWCSLPSPPLPPPEPTQKRAKYKTLTLFCSVVHTQNCSTLPRVHGVVWDGWFVRFRIPRDCATIGSNGQSICETMLHESDLLFDYRSGCRKRMSWQQSSREYWARVGSKEQGSAFALALHNAGYVREVHVHMHTLNSHELY